MVGSIQERNLLERVFRDPGIIDSKVEDVMDPPFPLMDVAEPVEHVVPSLLANNSAVLVEEGGQAYRPDHSQRFAGVCGARSHRVGVG